MKKPTSKKDTEYISAVESGDIGTAHKKGMDAMRNFILGTDWWTDCDDAVALRVLLRAHKEGKINLAAIGINAAMEYSAASVDGFLNLEGVENIPVGIDLEATDYGGNPRYQKRLSESALRYKKNEDAEDAVRLYRRILAESEGKVEIIEIGFMQVIAAVIESGADDISPKTGMELFREKVSKVWLMAGKWDEEGGWENNFARTERTAKASAILCEKCPVPMTFLGFEIGEMVITGGNVPKTDFLGKVLDDHGSYKGRCSWDPMTALLAITGDEEAAGYKAVCGKARVDGTTGRNYFTEAANGPHKYVIKMHPDSYYEDIINDIIK